MDCFVDSSLLDPLLVAVGEAEIPTTTSCVPAVSVSEGEGVHSLMCQGQGEHVTVALPTTGPMSLCTLNAYGGYQGIKT